VCNTCDSTCSRRRSSTSADSARQILTSIKRSSSSSSRSFYSSRKIRQPVRRSVQRPEQADAEPEEVSWAGTSASNNEGGMGFSRRLRWMNSRLLKRLPILIIALLSSTGVPAFSQELPFVHYTTESRENPLPSAAVTGVHQDALGYIWFSVLDRKSVV